MIYTRAGRLAFFTPRKLTSGDDIRKHFDIYQNGKNPKRTEKKLGGSHTWVVVGRQVRPGKTSDVHL